jgi:hypothetical protein
LNKIRTITLLGIGMLVIFATGYRLIAFDNADAAARNTGNRTVTGRIVSQYGPVPDARVRVAGDEKYTLTDRQGQFQLETGHLPGKVLKLTAGKDGWFNYGKGVYPAGDSGDTQLNPLPREDNPEYRFISPATCAKCHNKLAQYWDRSKMAHTTSNPKVLDMYYGTDAAGRKQIGPGYKLDNPGDEGNCITCHAPSVAEVGMGSKDLKTALGSPRTEWDGISCEYCHKVRKVIKKETRPSKMAPVLKRKAPAKGNTILVLGPYDDVVNNVMAASYSPVFDEGRFCSTCHGHFKKLPSGKTWNRENVYTDSEWKGFGLTGDNELPVQTTYQEWKQWQTQLSAEDANKGKKCQDCHMSWRKEMLPYDNYVVDGQARNMWGTKRSPKNIRPHHFDGGTEIQLKTALSMELEGEVKENILEVKVYLTNTNGGHWVPTGETMRSVILLMHVTDSEGRPLDMIRGSRLPEWIGGEDPEIGNYAGSAGSVFARVLQDSMGNLNVPFWKATSIAFDTRIRPKKTMMLEFIYKLDDPGDEPTAGAKLIYRPVHSELANTKNWKTKDIMITSRVW